MHLSNFKVLDVAELLREVLNDALFKFIIHACNMMSVELIETSLGRISLLYRGKELVRDLCAGHKHGQLATLYGEVTCFL